MLPAYTTYTLYNRDLASSLKRVANDPIVSRDAKYYADNIGKIKNLDEFLKDHRLYSYAIKAYGLGEMTYAAAFMKKVLESNLNDPNSFANKLKDTRYRDFAAAFDFGTIKSEKNGSNANPAGPAGCRLSRCTQTTRRRTEGGNAVLQHRHRHGRPCG